MQVTVIVEDQFVGVDGEFRTVDLSELDPTIRIIQWKDAKGEIEFVDESLKNEKITNFAPYQWIVDDWTTAGIPPEVVPPELPTQPEIDEKYLKESTRDVAMIVAEVVGLLLTDKIIKDSDIAPSILTLQTELKVVVDRLLVSS